LIDMKSDVGYLSVIDWPLLPVNIFLFEWNSAVKWNLYDFSFSFMEPCVVCTPSWGSCG
jgi:hypothetical protein